MKMKKMLFGIAAVVAVTVLFTGCSNQSKESGSGNGWEDKDYFLGCTQSNTIEVLARNGRRL